MPKSNIHAFVSAKGGVGCTTTALIAANVALRADKRVHLIDLNRDMEIAVGVSPFGRMHMSEHFCGLVSYTDYMGRKLTGLDHPMTAMDREDVVFHFGDKDTLNWPLSLNSLVWRIAQDHPNDMVIIDAGVTPEGFEWDEDVTVNLVTNTCYSALVRTRDRYRHQDEETIRYDNFIVVQDNSRALNARDISTAFGRENDVTITMDRSVSRWMDSGLILDRYVKTHDTLPQMLMPTNPATNEFLANSGL